MFAIYARQSIDRTDSISIESQIEFCMYETKGEKYKVYQDKGYSGKNTNRPEFQRMMGDICNGKIEAVVVYKLDRISRSILDFATMMETFTEYNVKFISATEKFDTSSPMGNAMLNICIVFAQLERETIRKRIQDAYISRSSKGFYMGGQIPYGFKKVPITIDGVRTSMYEPIDEEISVVRLIYSMYATRECSYGDIVRELDRLGIIGDKWSRSKVSGILRNPIYVKADLNVYYFYKSHGVEIQNQPEDFIGSNGCYFYRGQNKNKQKHTNMDGSTLVLAPHEGIVNADIWLKCRERILNNKMVTPTQKAKNTWLAGKVKCGRCGYALTAKTYRQKKDQYLLCSHRGDSKKCPGAGLLKTPEVEAVVLNEIKNKLREFKVLQKEKQNLTNPRLNALIIEKEQISIKIDDILKKVPFADSILMKYLNDEIEQLDDRKKAIELEIDDILLSQSKTPSMVKIQDYVDRWEDLTFDNKRMVVDILIDRISLTSEKMVIQWRV